MSALGDPSSQPGPSPMAPAGDPAGGQAVATAERPPAPRGPGVIPPFAAPPTDGIRRRMWIGLTAGAVALILCCVGGVGGFIALAATAEKARSNAATNVVSDFLTDWVHGDYPGAYQLLCEEIRDQTSLADFTSQVSAEQLAGYELDTPDLSTSVAVVPARLEYASGQVQDARFDVVVESDGRSAVCSGPQG